MIETLRKNAWLNGLKSAGIEYRPIIQTRHTFANMMISAGENLGWTQKMLTEKILDSTGKVLLLHPEHDA